MPPLYKLRGTVRCAMTMNTVFLFLLLHLAACLLAAINTYRMDQRDCCFWNLSKIVRWLEVWFYMNGPSKLTAPISSKQLFGLQLCFQCSSLVYLLKFNWFEQKKVHYVYSKLNLRPTNCLLKIGASNLERLFIYGITLTECFFNLILEVSQISTNRIIIIQIGKNIGI